MYFAAVLVAVITRRGGGCGTPDGHEHGLREENLSIEELAARQGITPIKSVAELAEPEAFESDAELAAFLADLHMSRRTSIG